MHPRRKSRPNSGWVIKGDRPEEYLKDPKLYYTEDEVERYSRSGGMRRAQERIASRVLELLDIKKGGRLLDLGCGPGYTAFVYGHDGLFVTGLDVVPKMVRVARSRGIDAYEGDMRDAGEIFKDRTFDAVVSVSALQWLKKPEDIRKVALGVCSLLDNGSHFIVQFYPMSEDELMRTAKEFGRNGLDVRIMVDYPDDQRKRTIYLVMEKD